MTPREAKAIVLAAYPGAKARSVSAGRGRPKAWHIDDGDPFGGDLTPRPSETAGKAWIMAAGQMAKGAR